MMASEQSELKHVRNRFTVLSGIFSFRTCSGTRLHNCCEREGHSEDLEERMHFDEENIILPSYHPTRPFLTTKQCSSEAYVLQCRLDHPS